MKKTTNFKKMHIFFVGIGGISMSGLAKISLLLGGRVSGSDSSNGYLPEISKLGGCVYLGHNSSHITDDIDLIVYTGAIKEGNVELLRGKELEIPMVERSEFLGMIAANFKNVIAIAGTHGKTTVTSMVGHIFNVAKLKPTIHLGGESLNLKSNTILGENDYFILEACEYRESFLSLSPNTAVILNIDKDHLDYYKTFENVQGAFDKFAKFSDFVFAKREDKVIHNNMEIVDSSWSVKDIKNTKLGYKYNVYYKDNRYLKVKLNVMGRHNIENSLFAIAVSHHYNIPKKVVRKALETYLGVKRRYEIIGKYVDIPVMADYAHHPEEIEKSMEGIRERYKKPLFIFQPHTYSRTESLMGEFISVLNKSNDTIIYSTYPAREKYNPKGSAYILYTKLKKNNTYYSKNMENLKSLLRTLIVTNSYDIIVVLGAGNLYDKIKEIL